MLLSSLFSEEMLFLWAENTSEIARKIWKLIIPGLYEVFLILVLLRDHYLIRYVENSCIFIRESNPELRLTVFEVVLHTRIEGTSLTTIGIQ